MSFAAAGPAPLRRQAARGAAAADRKSRANRPSDGCHGPCFSVRNTRLRRPFGHVFLLQHAEAFCNSESHFPGGSAIPRRAKVAALAGMAIGFALFWFTGDRSLPMTLAVILVMAGGLAYVFSRPS